MLKDERQSKSQATNEIQLLLDKFSKNSQKQVSLIKTSQQLHDWFIKKIINSNISKVPRISILKECVVVMRRNLTDPKLINSLFIQQQSVCSLVLQCQQLISISFILRQHLSSKALLKRIQYCSTIQSCLNNKLQSLLTHRKGNLISLFHLQHPISFIQFKQSNPGQIYNKLGEYQLQELRQEVYSMFMFAIVPWIQRQRPKIFYQELGMIVYWILVMDDQTNEREDMLLKITLIIDQYICSNKNTQGVFIFMKTFSIIFDVLSITYRKQDPFRPEYMAPLLNRFQALISEEIISNWISSKGKQLKPQQIQQIFRNAYHTGSSIFLFNLIQIVSKTLKQSSNYNILYHLYVSYIKKDFLDIVLPNTSFIPNYFDILQFYVIGFINQDRLDGQSQLDKLTKNLTSSLLRFRFNFRKYYRRLIMFYKVYQVRFSYLSYVSKTFLNDLIRLYKYKPDLSQVHHKISQGIFRDAGLNGHQRDSLAEFQTLNIKPTDRYRGMMNLGNTCYMNSFMQAMFMTKKFNSTILEIRDQQSLTGDKKLSNALINLFTQMSTKSISLDPEVIPHQLKLQSPQPFCTSHQQHDVAQFGRIYFQSLTNQLSNLDAKNRIEKIFFNKIKKTISCYKCRGEKAIQELVFDFILHLNKNDTEILVSKMLKQYFKGEQMNDQNQVYCQRCRRNTNSIATIKPIKFAEYLIITIGLFQYSGGGKKIKKPFNFQFNINLGKILPNQTTLIDQNYQLYAFIVHIGNESQRGHYICYARNLEQNPTVWYCFDDSYVTERQIQKVSDFHFGQSQTPYLLFYSASKKRKSLQNPLSTSQLKNLKQMT